MRRPPCLRLVLVSLALLASAPAYAGPPLLPPQLVAACAKLATGAPCSVDFDGKRRSGVCQQLPDQSRACLPAKGGAKRRPKPSP